MESPVAILRFEKKTMVNPMLLAVLLLAAVIIIASGPEGTGEVILVAILSTAAIGFAIYRMLAFRHIAHEVYPDRLLFQRLNGSQLTVNWTDIARIRLGGFARGSENFWFKLRSGEVLQIPFKMTGVQTFARVILANVSPTRMESAAYLQLKAHAEGTFSPW
jgi:hypothetical protein